MKKDKLIALGLILLLCYLVVFLRINLISLPHFNNIAKTEVYDEALDIVKKDVDKQYASLPQEKKDALVDTLYKNYLKQNKYFLNEKIKSKADEKRAFYQNDKSHTYIFGIDSYYWLRLIDNLRHKGHIGESIKDGQDYDDLVDMPIEKSLSKSMHIILGSTLYKIFDIFKLDIDYDIGLYIISLLFSVLLAVITFVIAKSLSGSNIAAFLSTIVINLSPLFLQRTLFEWLDTDIYNVFFPLLIFGAFLFVFKYQGNIKKSLTVLVFSLSCALYASVWQGWWHIFDLLILCGLIFILNDYYSEGKDIALFKKNISWLSLLFVLSIVLVGLLNGRESFISFITEPQKMISALKNVPQDNWPNIFLTVAELRKASPYTLANETGGLVVFFVAIAGSIYLVLSKKVLRGAGVGISYFCLFIWLGALYYASLNALRFALLLIVPLGLMFGIVTDIILRKLFSVSLKYTKKVHFAILGVMVFVVCLFLSFYISRAIDISYYKIPLMNDAWHKSLVFIKDNSSKDAIINAWWDYGHWYTQIAKRHVLFDGKTQNSPVAFWMAKVLKTDDEEQAIGILRMLDISKNKAFDLLESYGLSHIQIINTLNDILKLPESEARTYLKKTLDDKKIDALIPLLYKDDMPEAYFIASFDTLVKIRAITHIANWDFKKGDIWLHFAQSNPIGFADYLEKEYDYTKEEVSGLFRDLSLLKDQEALPWISHIDNIYPNSLSIKSKDADSLMVFDNGVTVDLNTHNAYISRGIDVDIGIPYSVAYIKDGILEEKVQDNKNLDHSVLIFKGSDDTYKNIFLDKDLVRSMFSRMYFLKGETLKYFKKVHEEKTPEGNYIFVYKIEWPK